MSDEIAFERPGDGLYRTVPLPHEVVIPVLGIPVRFRSNARAVVDAAEAAFAGWRALEDRPDLVEPDEVTVRLVVHAGDEGGAAEHAEVTHRVIDPHRVLYHSRGSMAVTDPGRREAVGFVTPAFVADRQHFRYVMIEGMTMALVTPLDRQPFHAAALERDGSALLLAGRSGVGKSTLAYAAVREGVRVLSEDTVFLQSRPTLRVWGLPGYLHLAPEARRRFPELADEDATLHASGKRKLALDLGSRDALPELPLVDRAAICVVERNGSGPGLEPLTGPALLERLTRDIEPGFDLFADTVGEPLGKLTANGGWRLNLTDDPVDCLPLVMRMLAELAGNR